MDVGLGGCVGGVADDGDDDFGCDAGRLEQGGGGVSGLVYEVGAACGVVYAGDRL